MGGRKERDNRLEKRRHNKVKPFGLNLGAKLIFIKDILGTMKEMELRVVLDK